MPTLLLRGPDTPEQQLITDLSPGWGSDSGGPGMRGKSEQGRRVFERRCQAEVRRGWEEPLALEDKTDRLANGSTAYTFPGLSGWVGLANSNAKAQGQDGWESFQYSLPFLSNRKA